MSRFEDFIGIVRKECSGFVHLGSDKGEYEKLSKLIESAASQNREVFREDLDNLKRMNTIALVSMITGLALLFLCAISLLLWKKMDLAYISAVFSLVMKVVAYLVYRRVDRQRRLLADNLPRTKALYAAAIIGDLIQEIDDENTKRWVMKALVTEIGKKN